MDRFEGREKEMIQLHKYILNIDNAHMTLFKELASNRMDKDLVKIEFVEILDTIMGTAYRLFTGDIRSKNIDELYSSILEEFFNKNDDDIYINNICSNIEIILNNFLLNLITLGISINRVLFVENANNKGIVVTEYDVTYLRNNNSQR